MPKKFPVIFARRLLFAALALMLAIAASAPALAAAPLPALARVNLTPAASLEKFIVSGLPALAMLDSPTGNYLLAVLTPAQQAQLAAQGFPVTVLDPDSRGAAYYLLYEFRAGAFSAARAITPLLEVDGQRAVARAAPQQIAALSALGIELDRLGPQPIQFQAQATASFPETVTPDPLIQQMLDQVTSATVNNYTRQLAGELPVWVDGGWYTITTRYTYSGTPIQKAGRFVGQRMQELGLDVEYHQWNAVTNPNVIGELPGLTQPDDIFIIGAHLDDVQGTPGADDNASGSVATLLAAEILSQYNWGCTLRFAFWTGEEQGLLGSDVYATRSHNLGENIVGYLNLDMIAYNTLNTSPGIDLIYHPSRPLTQQLAQLFSDVVAAYNINLVPQLVTSLGGGSDHQSFWDQGYTSILAIEDQGDFNPAYHGPGDTPAHNDLTYHTNFVKASLGTFAHMSGCLLPDLGGLAGEVSDSVGNPIPGASVEAAWNSQAVWTATSDADGAYSLGLPTGYYTVTATAPGYMLYQTAGISVSAFTTTTLDITLEVTPTYVISGFVTDAVTGQPVAAELSVSGDAITQTHTDPATGYYELALMMGEYSLDASAEHYLSQNWPVSLHANQQQDVALDHLCLLVVDDDGGAGYESYYQSSLDALGITYQTLPQPPALDVVSRYSGVLWFTGSQASSTLTPDDQALLGQFLDGNGRLFLSGQNVGDDIGDSSFFAEYLHADARADDTNTYILAGQSFLAPLVDIVILGAGGANNQTSPGEIAPANGGVAVYDYAGSPLYGGVAYTETHGVVFFSFGFEAINRAEDRQAVMAATLAELNICTPGQPPQAAFDFAVGSNGLVDFENRTQGSPWITYAWDFGDGSAASAEANPQHTYSAPGEYTVTLVATSTFGQSTSTLQVAVSGFLQPVYLPLVVR